MAFTDMLNFYENWLYSSWHMEILEKIVELVRKTT